MSSPDDILDHLALTALVVIAILSVAFMANRADAHTKALERELAQARLEGRVIDIPLEWEESDHPDWDGVEP